MCLLYGKGCTWYSWYIGGTVESEPQRTRGQGSSFTYWSIFKSRTEVPGGLAGSASRRGKHCTQMAGTDNPWRREKLKTRPARIDKWSSAPEKESKCSMKQRLPHTRPGVQSLQRLAKLRAARRHRAFEQMVKFLKRLPTGNVFVVASHLITSLSGYNIP